LRNITDARWERNGMTVAGGHRRGNATNQLNEPRSLFVDENQTMFIADSRNHRIVRWKLNDTNGEVVLGGLGQGNRLDQLSWPSDMLIDKETNSLIICDRGNRRVLRWSLSGNATTVKILLRKIFCFGIALDDQRYLYISDSAKHEVSRYKIGKQKVNVVAGGNGEGSATNQLNWPTYIFVDREQSVYVSDFRNHRVMKWKKDAKQGIVAAGGQGKGIAMTQLSNPRELFVDRLGTIFVAADGSHRVMRWPEEATQGTVIVGTSRRGRKTNQLACPWAFSFDQHGNIYVLDHNNYRVQRFSLSDGSSSFTTKENWIYPGNDMGKATIQTTYAKCRAECFKDERCKVFSWNQETRSCSLKSTIGNGGEYDPNAQSGYREEDDSELVMKENWVYPGNDLGEATNQSTYAACRIQCFKEEQCKAFSWNNKTYICSLKSSIGNGGRPDPNFQSGFREEDDSEFVMKENWMYPGNDLGKATTQTTYEKCRAECSEDEQCKAFSWNRKTRSCSLKSTIGSGGEYDPNAQSGYREGKKKRREKW
ncbi:unnamed protein product, partial [Rotaria magnacalcarata]